MNDLGDSFPLLVVLDTNQWRAQYGLRSNLGAALLHLVSQHEGRIGLPEVVEVELVKHLVDEGVKAADSIDAQLRIIQNLTGSMPSIHLPSRDELASAVAMRIEELAGLLHRVEIGNDHTRRALDRANAGRSPNRKKEQLKDSLIWEACRDLGRDYDVHLVTADTAFFEPQYDRMADDLRQECETDGLTIHVHRDVAHLLEFLRRSAPRVDYEAIARSLLAHVAARVNASIAGQAFELGELRAADVRAFATEMLDRLALTFDLQASMHDLNLSEDLTGRQGCVSVSGEAILDTTNGTMESVSLERVTAEYVDEDGHEVRSVNAFVSAHLHLGAEPPRPMRIRAPID